MRQSKIMIGLAGLTMLFFLTGGAWAQSEHGKQEGMCGMMGGMGGMGGMEHGGKAVENDGKLMHGFHAWTRMLMAHADTLGLESEQIEKIDQMITAHLVKAIRDQAEVRAAMVTLEKDLRAKEIDLKSVEKQLQDIHGNKQRIELEGIRLYTQVLGVLTPEQRDKMQATIGTPFPRPWGRDGKKGSMMSPHGSGPEGREASKETHH